MKYSELKKTFKISSTMINTQNTVICTGSREPPQTLWLALISFVHCIPSLSTMNGTEKLLMIPTE